MAVSLSLRLRRPEIENETEEATQVKHHLWIVIAIAVGFSTFMLGYSLPPFLEVGFSGGDNAATGAAVDEDASKQYEELLKATEE